MQMTLDQLTQTEVGELEWGGRGRSDQKNVLGLRQGKKQRG
jgi:hypothetical protein